MKNNLITIVGVGLVVAGLLFAFELRQPAPATQAVGDIVRFTDAPTNTGGSCSSTSGILVATSTGRQYLAIVNDSANTVYLGLGVTAVGGTGIRLNATGGTYEITQEALFTGVINCIASSTSHMTILSK